MERSKKVYSQSLLKLSIVESLRDREVACSASDPWDLNFKYCVWRAVSSHSSHHPREVLLPQFSLYVHKSGLKPDSFHFLDSREIEGIPTLSSIVFFRRNPSVLLQCNPRTTLAGFSWGCMVIVLKGSF